MTEDEMPTPPSPAKRSDARPARRFADDEVARILKLAVELQERSHRAAPDGSRGLTLDELRQVATEVGIDPTFVDQAALQADAAVRSDGHALVGAPTRWHLRLEVPGELTERDLGRVMQELRSTMQARGEISEVFGRVEWSHDEGVGPTVVAFASHDGVTDIEVSGIKSAEAQLMYGLGVPFGAVFIAAGLAGPLGLSGPAVLPLVAASAATVYGGLRLAWKARSAWWKRKLQGLADRLASSVGEAAALPPPAATSDGEDPS